jgi:hypothetical protein
MITFFRFLLVSMVCIRLKLAIKCLIKIFDSTSPAHSSFNFHPLPIYLYPRLCKEVQEREKKRVLDRPIHMKTWASTPFLLTIDDISGVSIQTVKSG